MRQKSHGGWGYPDKPAGDTSMTQYAVLAYWEMSKVGYLPQLESTERVANWLLRTQDPGGNWGYQGKEAEGRIGFELVKQDSSRPGMTAAGLGATYMVADLLGLGEVVAEQDASLPPSVRSIRKGQPQQARTRKVDVRRVRQAQDRGREWMKKNYAIDVPELSLLLPVCSRAVPELHGSGRGQIPQRAAMVQRRLRLAEEAAAGRRELARHGRPGRGEHGVCDAVSPPFDEEGDRALQELRRSGAGRGPRVAGGCRGRAHSRVAGRVEEARCAGPRS